MRHVQLVKNLVVFGFQTPLKAGVFYHFCHENNVRFSEFLIAGNQHRE
jgi:hypothetical protein